MEKKPKAYRTPIMVMLITMGASVLLGGGLIAGAAAFGAQSRYDAGYGLLDAAIKINLPGGLIFSALSGLVGLVVQVKDIGQVDYAIISCLISTLIYGAVALRVGVYVQNRKIARGEVSSLTVREDRPKKRRKRRRKVDT